MEKQVWNDFKNKTHEFDKLFKSMKSSHDPFFETVLIKNLILFLSGNEFESFNNLTRYLYRNDIKKFYFDFYLTVLKIISDKNKKKVETFSNLIFGLGTGRSGSTSLYSLLSEQENTFSSHEYPPLIKWENDKKNVFFHLNKCSILLNNFNFVADVSHWWLKYVELIIKKYPNSVFICMQRDKHETVFSFLRIKGYGNKGTLNHWTNHDGKHWRHNIWDDTYPKYKTNSLKYAIEKYWDQYYFISESLEKKFPNNFRIFNIQNFSSEEGQLEILQFCKFPNPKLHLDIKKNTDFNRDGEIGWHDIKKLL